MTRLSLGALAAAGLMAAGATSASAADLGGSCCADLEERIAELEATTVRKGNRKVSLTLSGWVAEQIMWWDDGHESNVYVSGIGTTLASNFKLAGQATIANGWTAGYLIHIEANTGDTFVNNQFSDESTRVDTPDVGFGTRTLQSYWWVKSELHGKVSLGRLSQASDNAAILVDGSGSLVPANWVLFEGSGFFMRNATLSALAPAFAGLGTNADSNGYTSLTWGSVFHCNSTFLGIGADCNGVPENVIRYDSPTFAGFGFSASWGEDDMWDVAARYAGEHNGFKIALAIAYNETSDENTVGIADAANFPTAGFRDASYFQIGGYVQHVATGLFVYAAYGDEDANSHYIDPLGDGAGGENYGVIDNSHWYIKAGIRTRCTPLGHTVLYGEYGEYSDALSPALVDAVTGGAVADTNGDGVIDDADAGNGLAVTGSEAQIWGLGVVQEIDAAAMSVWLHYRNVSADVGTNAGTLDMGELDLLKFGALINF